MVMMRALIVICGLLIALSPARTQTVDPFIVRRILVDGRSVSATDQLSRRGPDGSEKEVVSRFQEMHGWFAPMAVAPESVHLSERYAWMVKLDNGITVELGREQTKTTLKERVDRLVAVYPQLVARLQNRIESVDMRYPNGLALRASGMGFGPDAKKETKKNK